MRTISRSSRFKSDFKKVLRMPRYRGFETILDLVVVRFLADTALPKKLQDHALKGDWVGYRECHLQPDLLLIYSADDEQNVTLMRLGTHSELFK